MKKIFLYVFLIFISSLLVGTFYITTNQDNTKKSSELATVVLNKKSAKIGELTQEKLSNNKGALDPSLKNSAPKILPNITYPLAIQKIKAIDNITGKNSYKNKKKLSEKFMPAFKDFHLISPLPKNFPTTDYTISLEFQSGDNELGLLSFRDNESAHDREIWYQDGYLFSRLWTKEGDETIQGNIGKLKNDQWHKVSVTINSETGTTLFFDGQSVATGARRKSDFNWATDLHIGYINLHKSNTPTDFFSGNIRNVNITDFSGEILGDWKISEKNITDNSTYKNNAQRVLLSYTR